VKGKAMTVSPVEVQKHLKGVDYPAKGEELAATAQQQDAPEEVVEALRDHSDESFDGPNAVMEAVKDILGGNARD